MSMIDEFISVLQEKKFKSINELAFRCSVNTGFCVVHKGEFMLPFIIDGLFTKMMNVNAFINVDDNDFHEKMHILAYNVALLIDEGCIDTSQECAVKFRKWLSVSSMRHYSSDFNKLFKTLMRLKRESCLEC